MKSCFVTLKKANRYNDWSFYQKSGPRLGTISWKALLRPLSEVVPTSVSSKPVTSVSRTTFWKRIVSWFKSLFKFLKFHKKAE